jgi:serine/threonine protein phosphatase PrpC
MSQVRTDFRWGFLGCSQQGASHIRQNLPNQDAIAHWPLDDGSASIILAVADGHGSAKSFRSHQGAQFAVETAVTVCREFLDRMKGAEPSAVKSEAELRIPRRIFQEWKRRVEDHHRQNPFSDAELDHLAQQAGLAARERAMRPEQVATAYGSTLLAVALADDFLISFQLGDGDVLVVSDATGVAERVIPKDESLIANETTSLCQGEDGLRYVRYRFQLFRDSPPAMLLLSTDGYVNSFASPDAFLKVGADYLDMLRRDGSEEITKSLPRWLEDTSSNGSGDDITVGIIYRRHPPLSTPESRPAEAASPAASASTEHAPETKAAGDVSEELSGTVLPPSERVAGEMHDHKLT